MHFRDIQGRLIELARRRIHSGRLTERGLAKSSGVSQPHLHNVLKNVRALSNASTDRLMGALEVTVVDLLGSDLGGAGVRAVPVLKSRLGPGFNAVMTVHQGVTPLPTDLVAGLMEPVAALLAPDMALPRLVAVNDLVLLDQSPAVRSGVRGGGVWIVEEEGCLRVRYLFNPPGTVIYTANETTVADRRQWRPISLAGKSILDTVRARIVWIGREFREEPAAA